MMIPTPQSIADEIVRRDRNYSMKAIPESLSVSKTLITKLAADSGRIFSRSTVEMRESLSRGGAINERGGRDLTAPYYMRRDRERRYGPLVAVLCLALAAVVIVVAWWAR